MLEQLKRQARTVGIKQTIRLVEENRAKAVFVAGDADDRVTAELLALCGRKRVQVIVVESMKMLGRACGIEVGAAVAALAERE